MSPELTTADAAAPAPHAPGDDDRVVAMYSEEQVREYCRANLTGYKQPRVIEFRTEMPKTPVGKILRRELRDKK